MIVDHDVPRATVVGQPGELGGDRALTDAGLSHKLYHRRTTGRHLGGLACQPIRAADR